MYSEKELLAYWFASAEGVGAATYANVAKNFDLQELFYNPSLLKSAVKRVNSAAKLAARANAELLTDELMRLHSRGIKAVTCESEGYPQSLKHVYLPPIVLFVKGNLNLGEHPFAVVGTREATRTGMENALRISEELAAAGMCIVSGMARGIDAAAHSGALKAGSTVAVLGCGVDIIYPSEHRKLYESIMEKGAIVSEFFPGTRAVPGNFPQRNRIITGLSLGVLVCEGEMKSGAHITANLALDQGKDVFGMPGDISSQKSVLPNSLIEDGARIATGSLSILKHYGLREGKIVKEKCAVQLDFFQQQIYNQLLKGELTLDELAELTGFAPAELASQVTLMEIEGVVSRLSGGNICIK